MLRNTTQHFFYHKQQTLNEISNLLSFLIKCVYILIPFNVIELFRKYYFPDTEFFLSFMFWTVCLLLIVYWMPNKKEYLEWKKTHSTF